MARSAHLVSKDDDHEKPRNGAASSYARKMLGRLTLAEKVQLLAGRDMWRTHPIPHLGIPQIKTSDGPVGVRGGAFVDGVTAASLPTGVSLAATWDLDVIQDICSVLVSEAKSKGVDVLLGPTVCIPRTPLGGRNFEAYSEDPFLTGKLAAKFINELQNQGVGACIKHFASNDQETRRFFIDARIPERALREIHLQPFQIAIRDSQPWTLMTAYNKVNETFCSGNKYLLETILRGEWGFDGLVMSDWFGTNSVVPSLQAGMDLEMPGPTRRRGEHLLEAHRQGLLDTTTIDASAERLLTLIERIGKSQSPLSKEAPERAVDLPEHREIMRKAGADGIVLLRNNKNLLPLKNLDGKSVAIIGPNAARSVATGGGSSNLNPHYRTNPYLSLKQRLEKDVRSVTVQTAPGIISHRFLPLLDSSIMTDPITGESGFALEIFRGMTHSGDPVGIENRPSSNLTLYDMLPKELTSGERYSYRARTTIQPKTSGLHEFSLSTCGPGKLILDGKLLIDIERRWWSPKSPLFMSYGSPEKRVQVSMEAGRQYELVLESVSREPKPYELTYTGDLEREEMMDGGRIGFFEYVDRDALFQKAEDLARTSSIAIVVVGKDSEWESETSDMVSMELPPGSDELIKAAARANSNIIVVNQTGSPISMPWENDVSAIIQAWYQGQEQGNSLADILLGDVNPSGKLPITFPRHYEDNPSYGNYPGEDDVVHYTEGIFVGYRHYDHHHIDPMFPFGWGLSYTTYEYSNIRLSSDVMACESADSSNIVVKVDVTNTGKVTGKEIVQFYVTQVTRPGLVRPIRELKGWDKVFARPGETVTAQAVLDRVSLSYWDDTRQRWTIDQRATFAVTAARHSRDEGLKCEFRSRGGFKWIR